MIVSLMFVFSGNFLIRNWTIALCRSSAEVLLNRFHLIGGSTEFSPLTRK